MIANASRAGPLAQDSRAPEEVFFGEIAARAINHHHARRGFLRHFIGFSVGMLFSQAEFAAANSRWRLLTGFLFEVAAKLKAHGGKNFAGEIVFAARSEALISEAVSTGAGVVDSIAARTVQRPSPESDTRPEKRSSVGCSRSEMAVKSRSHDATTLPRRQTSATSARLKSY